ncbi:MAG: metalloregulator ArsR/SmtB family transcription factor [Candidatus Omnitrophica bacterium]|nr:metalloregulator ArsR/SmtB family transcription factor [Candidatus Omnitrophota bacterium]
MDKYTEIIKAIGERTRLRIVRLMMEANVPLCVCEIMDCLGETQTNISKHLRILKLTGIVKEKKIGKWVMYSLVPYKGNFMNLLFQMIQSIPSTNFRKEIRCLKKRMSLRIDGKPIVGIIRKK